MEGIHFAMNPLLSHMLVMQWKNKTGRGHRYQEWYCILEFASHSGMEMEVLDPLLTTLRSMVLEVDAYVPMNSIGALASKDCRSLFRMVLGYSKHRRVWLTYIYHNTHALNVLVCE